MEQQMSTADRLLEEDPTIAKRVIHAVATVLDCDESKITVSTSLHELGAESLDYLDIAFSLERDFNIHFPRVDALQRAVAHFGEDQLWSEGKVTEFGLELLRESMPELHLANKEMRIADLRTMFVVGTLVRVVTRLLRAKAEMSRKCPNCQAELHEVNDSPELRCANCATSVPLPSGDDVMTADLIEIGTRLRGPVQSPTA
jgi:acyl carrier protein